MIKRSIGAVLFTCVAISAFAAADNPFLGDWKLDPSRSTLKDTMKVDSVGEDKYAFNFGGGSEAIPVDGRDHPSRLYGGTSLSVAVEGDSWKVVRKSNGRPMLSATWSLSSDGRMLTDRYTSFAADGTRYEQIYTYERKTPGTGFAGTWVSTSQKAVNFVLTLQIRSFQGNGISIIDPSSQILGNMNFAGPLVHAVDEHTLELIVKKNNGEPLPVLELKLSPDFKELTVYPRSGKADERRFLAFERQ